MGIKMAQLLTKHAVGSKNHRTRLKGRGSVREQRGGGEIAHFML